jgi:hypothetical protein
MRSQAFLEIAPVKLATCPRRFPGLACKQPGRTQALEIVFVVAAAAADCLPQRFTQTVVLTDDPEIAPQMVSEGAVVVRPDLFQISDRASSRSQCVESLAHKVRMATHQPDQALDVFRTLERRAVTGVQPEDLVALEIAQSKDRPDIEGRLVEIPDEERRFRGMGDQQVEGIPDGVSRPAIVPPAQGTEKTVAVFVVLEDVIDFIQAENNRVSLAASGRTAS